MSENIDVHKIFADYFENSQLKAMAYAVSKRLSEGHICLDLEQYNADLDQSNESGEENPYLEKGEQLPLLGLESMKFISHSAEDVQPFVINNGKLYLQRYFQYESDILTQINVFVAGEAEGQDKNFKLLQQHKAFIQNLFPANPPEEGLVLAEKVNWQLVAAVTSIIKQFSIITGGPGTGKTTTVAKILAILYTVNPELKVALAAPTGKAAARMVESLKSAKESLLVLSQDLKDKFDLIESGTIHRLLGYIKGSPYFKHDKDNPLEYDVVIVDESSMISAPQMAKLLEAVHPNSKIILLGDKDQLASVEAGSVFGDICLSLKEGMNEFSSESADFINGFISSEEAQIQSEFISKEVSLNPLHEHIVELKRSHRFKSSQGIGKFSKAVIQGKLSVAHFNICQSDGQESVEVVKDYQGLKLNELMDKYEPYIQEQDTLKALQKLNDIRFLCAVHSGKFGVEFYNHMIAKYLESKGLLKPISRFYENQPIIITQNNYSLGLFNGDVGIIRKDEKGNYKAWFEDSDGSLKKVLPGYITSFDTVFAMTIHKSQGSEFNSVAVVLPDKKDIPILTRELLYTGITRGKKEVVIFGSEDVIMASVERKVARASGITERILKN